MLIGLLSTELFIAISRLKALHISLGENVPPAVSKSFTALIPTILTLSLFAVLAAILANVLHTESDPSHYDIYSAAAAADQHQSARDDFHLQLR